MRLFSKEAFQTRGAAWVSVQLVLFALYTLAFLVPYGRLDQSVLFAGIIFLLWGAGLIWSAIWVMGPSFTIFPVPNPEGKLVRTGIFKQVRHPIYGGVILSLLGLSLVASRSAPIAVVAALGFFFYRKSEFEEITLIERFPEYTRYKAETPRRMLPFLWF